MACPTLPLVMLGIVVVGAAACADPTGANAACQQTGEFGNTGCAEIRGVVVNRSGSPEPGIVVGPRFLSGQDVFNASYATTDSQGRFRFRITRFSGQPAAAGPDTMSLFVHAADPRTAGVNVPATVRDSVPGQVTISPVGRVPTALSVTIALSREQ